jgi:predicted  nucleic acid-binding Zn-ribbon protein
MTHSFRAALLAALVASAPAALHAQQRPSAPSSRPAAQKPAPAAQQPAADVQAWVTELQSIDQQLQGIQMRALQDPALDSARQSVGAQIEAAVIRADASLAGLPAQVSTLQAKLQQAQQAGDQATYQQLVGQAQALEARFLKAREKALADPELAARVQRFQNDLEKKMTALEPGMPKLLARGKELQAKIEQAVASNGGPR